MVHESEKSFHDKVHEYLIDAYGENNVTSKVYLEESYRFADFWVHTPIVDLAIEVENDFNAVIRGVGQAFLYAAHSKNAVPVVIVPKGHIEQPEVDMLRQRITITELEL